MAMQDVTGNKSQEGNKSKTSLPLPRIAEAFGLAEGKSNMQTNQDDNQEYAYMSGNTEAEVSSVSKGAQLHCSVCSVSISGIEAFRQHCAGRRHLNKLQTQAKVLLEKGGNASMKAGDAPYPLQMRAVSAAATADRKSDQNLEKKASIVPTQNGSYVGEHAKLGYYCKQVPTLFAY